MRFTLSPPPRKFHRTKPPTISTLETMRVYARKLPKSQSKHRNALFIFYVFGALFLVSIIYVTLRAHANTFLASKPALLKRVQPSRPYELHISKLKTGPVFHLPASWNRLHSPWYRPPVAKLLTPKQSRYRYLYSSTRLGTSDGIGHSMGVINYEFNIALRFNLTYTHRVGFYSSLTAADHMAVENFFGWGLGEVPRTDIQKHGCEPHNGRWPNETQIYQCHICKQPLRNGSLHIKHVVNIPHDLISKCRAAHEQCSKMMKIFVAKHKSSHTVFQTPKQVCSPPATDANFLLTKGLFYHKYWKTHGVLPWTKTSSLLKQRPIRLMHNELNVAVHVRRGDFLNPEVQARRGITKDATFAKVIISALSIVNDVGGVFSTMPVTIHIYSEGKIKMSNSKSVHAVDSQDHSYYDYTGRPREADWWRGLILKTSPNSKLTRPKGLEDRLTVVMHISQDTLHCLHEMVSADIFIGSQSGLSNALVWSLSRGVSLVPNAGTIDGELGKKGYVCCSVAFDNEKGSFLRALFKRYWTAYVKANEDSAAFAVNSLRGL